MKGGLIMKLIEKINQKLKENETESPTLEKLKCYFKSLDYESAEVSIFDDYVSVSLLIDKKFPFDLISCNSYFKKIGIENFMCDEKRGLFFMMKLDLVKELGI